MADKRITQLNAVTTPSGSDVFAIVNSSETKKITYENVEKNIRNSVNTSSFVTNSQTGSFLIASDTGSLMVTGSLSGSSLVFEKGDSTTFDIDLSESFITPSQTGSLVNTSYGLYNQTGSYTGVSASIAESSIIGGGVGTLSVPANGFRQGDAYHVVLTGNCTFHNNDNLRIRVKADSVSLIDTGDFTVAGAANKTWKMDVHFSIHEIGGAGTAKIVSAGTFMYTKDASTDFQGVNFNTENSSSFDTTIDNQLSVTAQFNHGDNILTTQIFTLHKIY